MPRKKKEPAESLKMSQAQHQAVFNFGQRSLKVTVFDDMKVVVILEDKASGELINRIIDMKE